MKAWRIFELGEPCNVMRLEEIPVPQPGPDQILVRVLGAAANFPDVLMCRGLYQTKPDMPFTPGLELCGEVVASGSNNSGFSEGDRVIGMAALGSGAFAEFAVMEASSAFAAPIGLADAEAASFFIGYQTGWFGLRHRAHLVKGETLLVHAAAGGVGSAAVQLAKAMGARVIGVVGGREKVEVAKQLGADIVVDRRRENFVEIVKEVTDGQGADVVYDPVGGVAYTGSTKCIAFEGRIVIVGFAGGDIQSAALNHALVKNYSIIGLHWGLYAAKNPSLVRECHFELTELVEAGQLMPLVSERVPLAAVADAIQRLADGKTVGRLAYVP
jgi:NADPH2:quinone reductase